ncbi:hypothetical protein BDW74DRAFT_177275 [Aspergillus multicolor]|uniref:Gfo/Idh/MocA family protein n=1 Tax=Aspergillus multicolor TaxID=41759 RepID=UPI003CCD33C2
MEIAFSREDIAKALLCLSQDKRKFSIKGNDLFSPRVSSIDVFPSNTANTEVQLIHNSNPSTLAATVLPLRIRAPGYTSRKPSLLTIPPELRLPIYEILLISRNPKGDISPLNLDVDLPMLKNRYLHTAILYTCNQIYNEANPILYGANAFHTMTVTPITLIGLSNFQMIHDLDIWVKSDFSLDSLLGLLSDLCIEAKALRKFSIIFEASEFSPGSAARGLGGNLDVVRALAKIKQLDKLLISGYYAKPWPAYLRKEMGPAGVEVFEESGDDLPPWMKEMIMNGFTQGSDQLELFNKWELQSFREWQKARMKQLTFLIIGAGSRGSAYARAITTSTPARISAVAEPDPFKRRILGERYIWGSESPKPSQNFDGWGSWITYETERRRREKAGDKIEAGVDGVLICTLDETHIVVLKALAKAGLLDLHVLCEKPLALSVDDCLAVYAAYTHTNSDGALTGKPRSIFSIGHVLRYSPHNLQLRRLVREEKVIGDIVSVEHTEPVGHWHFAHSYVRGNWRRETEDGDGSLLTKSCHDVDFLMWLVEGALTSPTSVSSDGNEEKLLQLRTVSSTGYLTQFTPSQKPPAAGSATNCTSCPIERDCTYSAIRLYRDNQLRKGETRWPINIVCPDIEDYLPQGYGKYNADGTHKEVSGEGDISAAELHLISTLEKDYDEGTPDEDIKKRTWYGRCVWESDNDVVDDQVVTLAWDVFPSVPTSTQSKSRKSARGPGITATLHMIAPTQAQCIRRGRIYGTAGEITYTSSTITIYTFADNQTRVIEIPKQPPEEEEAHGGGDYGLARGFVGAVEKVVNEGWDVEKAQRTYVGCTLEDVIKSHGVVFAAEESRRDEGVVRWGRWWEEKLAGVGL